MTIQINITFLIILIVIINEVLTHLLNWWMRRIDMEGEAWLFLMIYIIKITLLILCLTSLVGAK